MTSSPGDDESICFLRQMDMTVVALVASSSRVSCLNIGELKDVSDSSIWIQCDIRDLAMDLDFSNLGNEKNTGCLGYIGDYTTQLYRDYNKPS